MSNKEFLKKLYFLQDLDLLIQQVEDPQYTEKTGLQVSPDKVEELKRKRKEIAQELRKANPMMYQRYEMLRRKYGRGITRVVNRMCTNCFAALPASIIPTDEKIITCPNCSIILIWLE